MAAALVQGAVDRVSAALENVPRSKLLVLATAGVAGALLTKYVFKKLRAAARHRKDGLKELDFAFFTLPYFGHAAHLLVMGRGKFSMRDVSKLALQYAPIVKFKFFDRVVIQTVDANIVQELSERDEDFQKIRAVKGPMFVLRKIAGDGLFTAGSEEPNWKLAHRILTPVFALNALKDYVPVMAALCTRMLQRAEELCDQRGAFDVPKLMTDLTFDTIGMCGLSVDFKSLSSNEPPKFIQAMNEGLHLLMRQLFTSNLYYKFFKRHEQQAVDRAAQYMFSFVDKIIADRRALHGSPESPFSRLPESPTTGRKVGRDLLDLMMHEADKKSGQKLPDENIRFQLVTLLVAGHETTSALLAFCLFEISRHADVEAKVLAEIDAVFPEGRANNGAIDITFDKLTKLTYLNQCLREALRLYSPAPVYQKIAVRDSQVAGYRIEKGTPVSVQLWGLHRNPAYWEEPVERFDPDRFSPENDAKRHPHAWKPWGDGNRACIGRHFALIESKAVIATLLAKYTLRSADPDYTLKIHEQLTLKPADLRMKLVRRQ